MKERELAGLDIMRFIAASMVMIYHFTIAGWAVPDSLAFKIISGRAEFPGLLRFTWFGFLGVEIFFVISGFVITYSAVQSSPVKFLTSRVVRLYPAAWICATISTFVVGIIRVEDVPTLALGYIHSLILYPIGPWADAVYWTLGIEMAFYAIVFCLILTKTSIEQFSYVLGGVSAAYWIVGFVVARGFISSHLWDRWLDLSLISYGVYFSLGIILYSIRERGMNPARALFGAILLVGAATEIHFKAGYANWLFHSSESQLVPIFIFLIASAAICMSLYSSTRGRWFRVLGLMTYPLYLLHDNLGAVVMRLLLDLEFNRYAALAVSVGFCMSLSILIAIYIEPVVQTILRFILSQNRVGVSTHLPAPE